MHSDISLAALVSGEGTNLEAMLDYGLPVKLVIADRPCKALFMAGRRGAECILMPRAFGSRFDRAVYTKSLRAVLAHHRSEVIACAGFMTVLDALIFERFAGLMVNTHPSLLPKYPGAHAVHDAYAAGEWESGCTVHVMTALVDTGPILAQRRVPRVPGDTVESWHQRIKVAEHQLYPRTIAEFIRTRFCL